MWVKFLPSLRIVGKFFTQRPIVGKKITHVGKNKNTAAELQKSCKIYVGDKPLISGPTNP